MPGDSRRDVGAASPRALAELRAGRHIDWSSENEPKMLEQLLGMPHNHLFDPKFGSPVYAGVPLDFSHRRCPVQVDGRTDINKLFDQAPQARLLVEHGLVSRSVLSGATTNVRLFAAGIADQIGQDLQTLNEPCQRQADPQQSRRAAELAVAGRLTELSQATLVEAGKPLGKLDREYIIIPPAWLHLILSDLNFGLPGEYFVRAPTATSPVQGGLADCWLIAALASVSWTRPELMAERIRRENPTGDVESAGDADSGHADFRFDFTDVLTIPLGFITLTIPFTFPIWTGEQVPQYAGGGYIYARSSAAGELWPAVIEKAVAVWRSGGNADFPSGADYGHLNGGDAAWACHILTGGSAWYHWADANDSWSTIQSHCSSARATSPLVAWTWGSSDDSPNKVDYAGANLVANHAYSILGTWETNNRQYVVLRNPWGYHEGSLNVATGTWSTQEAWGTASLTLPGSGVFALEIHTFREYFMGFGGAG
ncbi:MAG: C2 family cysteine protease [Thiobacillaceae bacterium]